MSGLKKLEDVLLYGDIPELELWRKRLTNYKHKLAREPYSKDKLLNVEYDLERLKEKLKEV